MASLRHIRITVTVPDNAPVIMEDSPLNKLSIASPDNAVRAAETPEASPPATNSAFKVIAAGTKFSAETETFQSAEAAAEAVFEAVAKTSKVAEQHDTKGEKSCTRDQISKLQECFSTWQKKAPWRYEVHKRETSDVVPQVDLRNEPCSTGLNHVGSLVFSDLKRSAGLTLSVEFLNDPSLPTGQNADTSDETTPAEPRESREEYNLAARIHNEGIASLDKELKPLRDAMNRDIPNFPINGRAIANLSSQQCDDLMKAFDLRSNASDVWTQQKICQYIGASSLSHQILLLEDENKLRRHASRW